MRLRPPQAAGLVAVIAFGAILGWTLMAPKPDPFTVPGAVKLNDAAPQTLPLMPPLPTVDPLAEDDLYCTGVLSAALDKIADRMSPEAATLRTQIRALAEAGVAKLGAAGYATPDATSDALAAQAKQDIAAGTPRLTLEACMTHVKALP
jgi:hypothetical protein